MRIGNVCGEDGTCEFDSCAGYTDVIACNYDPTATNEDETCFYPNEGEDCDGNCLTDCNDNGICDDEEIFGCTYQFACNYNSDPTAEDGSYEITSCAGCTYDGATNFNPELTLDNRTCIFEIDYVCSGDFDNDGIIDVEDLMFFHSICGTECN